MVLSNVVASLSVLIGPVFVKRDRFLKRSPKYNANGHLYAGWAGLPMWGHGVAEEPNHVTTAK